MYYKNFYNMQAEAFGSLPVLNLFYTSRVHQDGWRYIVNGIASEESFLLVTGDYGMGKTLLCMMLVRLLKKKDAAPLIYLPNPVCTYSSILSQIASALGITGAAGDDSETTTSIYSYLSRQSTPAPVHIVIDDAQELEAATLVKLRALANFNHNGSFPFRMFFFGHNSFIDLLKTPDLIPLGQRIKRKYRLVPLNLQETKEYVYFRLFKSGAPGSPSFADDALQEIYAASKGVPRLINTVCDAALTRGAHKMETVINRKTVLEALATSGEIFTENSTSARSGLPETAPNARPDTRPDVAASFLQAHAPPAESKYTPPQESVQPSSLPPHGEAPGTTWKYTSLLKIFLLMLGCYIVTRVAWQAVLGTNLGSEKKDPPPVVHINEREPPVSRSPAVDIRPEVPPAAPATTPASGMTTTPDIRPVQEPVPGVAPPLASQAGMRPDNLSAATAQTAPLRRYTLRVACYRSQKDADAALALYRHKGLSPVVAKAEIGQRGTWWLLYVGNYATRDEAVSARKLYDMPNAWIRQVPYANHIGNYSLEAAGEQKARLERLGRYPYSVSNGDGTFDVYVGAFLIREEAEESRRSLESKGIPNSVVNIQAP